MLGAALQNPKMRTFETREVGAVWVFETERRGLEFNHFSNANSCAASAQSQTAYPALAFKMIQILHKQRFDILCNGV